MQSVDPAGLGAAEQALLATAQGLLNRDGARVWLKAGGLQARTLESLVPQPVLEFIPGPWAVIASNRSRLGPFITCNVADHSFNLATSLAGQRGWLVVDASLRTQALALGLHEAMDARGAKPGAFARHGKQAARGILIHQPPSKALHLRDLAVALGAWVDFEPSHPDDTPLATMVRELGPGTDVLGWGSDERDFVGAVSQGGGWVLPADWALNLSAHRWLKPATTPRVESAPPPSPPRLGERVVAFVISDGDNLQWLLGRFTEAPGFWASPRRGSFAVTWELAPQLRLWAPAADGWLRTTATAQDAFVGGPSGGGYYFPHRHPDPMKAAHASARLLSKAGLTVTSVLNDGGDPGEVASLLANPGVEGVLYKDYAPYNRRRGAITWHHGKPVVAYRYLLWEQRRADGSLRPDWLPEGVAAAVASQPADPMGSDDAYALIQVHAWSFAKQGGPMEAIHDTIQRLPPGTRVVTAPVLIRWLQELRAPR
jgi:hypothetical protein